MKRVLQGRAEAEIDRETMTERRKRSFGIEDDAIVGEETQEWDFSSFWVGCLPFCDGKWKEMNGRMDKKNPFGTYTFY